MRLVLILAMAAGLAAPAAAASGEAAKRMPCRPPLAFARAVAHTDRSGADPHATLLLAVDKRVNGCRVLTPANARNGWVPEPTEPQGPAGKQPAKQG